MQQSWDAQLRQPIHQGDVLIVLNEHLYIKVSSVHSNQ